MHATTGHGPRRSPPFRLARRLLRPVRVPLLWLLQGRARLRAWRRLRALEVRAARTRPEPPAAGALAFRCNLCGAHGQAPESLLRDREAATCPVCGSNQRFRALVAALQQRLLGQVVPLRLQAPRPDLRGVGMSDADAYAQWLRTRFAYTNTYFHTTPFLDIRNPDPGYLGRQDFVISSDVLEHVAPPLDIVFANLRALLRPGGVLALTVPYGLTGDTVEHYPRLHDYHLEGEGAARRLVNLTRDGHREDFGDLCFHGGDGATLELRVFSLPDLLVRLEAAGFVDIRVHVEALPEWGILPATRCSLPITALAGPVVETASTAPMR